MDSLTNMMNIYSEIIEEARGHGDERAVRKLVDYALRKNLVRVEPTKKGSIVYSLLDDSFETIHKGDTSFHPLRRFIQKLEKMKLDKMKSRV